MILYRTLVCMIVTHVNQATKTIYVGQKSHHKAPADFDLFYYLRDDLYQNKGLFVFSFENLVRNTKFYISRRLSTSVPLFGRCLLCIFCFT